MQKNIFQKARTKLTIYYICIMAIIVITFSSVLILSIEYKIRQGFRDRVIIEIEQEDPIKNISDEIEFFIYTIDGILLVIIGFASYFLAGQTLKPIKRVLESQKKFIADASHDLRTPIAIITTDLEVTLKNKDSNKEDFTRLAISNLEEAKKMNIIVSDLLLLARTENNITETSNVHLSNLVSILADKMRSQIESKNLKLIKIIQEDIFINANKESLEKAIKNILQNAVNYTKAGSITLKLKTDNKKVTLEIIDTGVGIKEKDLPFIFDRFYKAEHSRNDNSGSGLGLPIAKEIIEKNKGTIYITSNVSVGTIVKIIF